jgi:hypothetical protein
MRVTGTFYGIATMSILAIDPGPNESGAVLWDAGVLKTWQCQNEVILSLLTDSKNAPIVAIEMIASYGMSVGKEVFETCVWIGRFKQWAINPNAVRLVYRKDIKIHLCGTVKAKDSNIRQALIDKYGPCGTRKNPGHLYGISGHLWAALAVADYVASNPL